MQEYIDCGRDWDIPKVSLSYLIVSRTSQEKMSSRLCLTTITVGMIYKVFLVQVFIKRTTFKSNASMKYLADSSCLNSVKMWRDSYRFVQCTFKANK